MARPAPFDNLFLSVGAQKSGTTWLYYLLNGHPDIYFTPEKELHYFAHLYTGEKPLSAERRVTRVKQKFSNLNINANPRVVAQNLRWYSGYLSEPIDDAWYERMFAQRRTQKFCADFSNLNCHLQIHDWNEVRSRTDNLKVIYIMRDPIQRLWSHLKFFLQFTGDATPIEGMTPRACKELAKRAHIWKSSDYSTAVSTLQRSLDQRDLKIAAYEHIHSDPATWLHELEAFLGISHIAYPAEKLQKRINVSPSVAVPDFFTRLFADDFRQQYTALQELGFPIPAQWARL